MAQTSIKQYHDPLVLGQSADGTAKVDDSYSAELAGITLGMMLTQGTADNQAKPVLVDADVTKLIGVSRLDYGQCDQPYAIGDDVTARRNGRLAVRVFEAVKKEDAATIGTGANAGKFGKTAAANTSVAAPAGVTLKYVSSAAANGLAILEINV
ncbi:MAG: structural cement protein Gp24 [Vibrio sp.]